MAEQEKTGATPLSMRANILRLVVYWTNRQPEHSKPWAKTNWDNLSDEKIIAEFANFMRSQGDKIR